MIKQQEEKRKQEAEAKKAEKKAKPQELPEQQEPKIIDADFREVEDEPRDDPAQEWAEAMDEQKETDVPAAQEPEIVEDPESYTLADVKEQLRKHEADLKAYREVGDLPSPMMQKQKILVDALQLLVEKKEFDEKEAAGID